jgi:hypothetical protein
VSEISLQWKNGIDGFLWIEKPNGVALEKAHQAVNYIRDEYRLFTDAELETLGAVVLFMSIREYGSGPPGRVLELGEKALDSFYFVLSDEARQQRIAAGMEALRAYLFPIRAGTYDELVNRAFEFIEPMLSGKSGAVE